MDIECDSKFASDLNSLLPNQLPPVTKLVLFTPGSGSATDPYRLTITAYGLLLAVGRASSAFADPNLRRFHTSAQWAVARWLWTLSDPDLAFTPESDSIKNHHRQAFSEALGLGAGLLIAEQRIAGGAKGIPVTAHPSPPGVPGIIDVDTHLEIKHGEKRPDLILFMPATTTPRRALILECKGNSEGRRKILDQFTKGVEQTLAIDLDAERVVAGAARFEGRVKAYAAKVDPPKATIRPSQWLKLRTDIPDLLAINEAQRLLRFASLDIPAFRSEAAQASYRDLTIKGASFLISDGIRSMRVTIGIIDQVAQILTSSENLSYNLDAAREVSTEVWAAWRAIEAERQGARERPDEETAEPRSSLPAFTVTHQSEGSSMALAADGCAIITELL